MSSTSAGNGDHQSDSTGEPGTSITQDIRTLRSVMDGKAKAQATSEVYHAKQKEIEEVTQNSIEAVSHWTDFPNPNSPKTELAKIQNLPYDVKHLIAKNLNVTASTCLGLSCRDFYNVHWKIHGPVPLMQRDPDFIEVLSDLRPAHPSPGQLPFLLSLWMEWKFGLKYRAEMQKFVTVKRWLEVDEAEYGKCGLEQRFFNSEVGAECANWDDWKHEGPRVPGMYVGSEEQHKALCPPPINWALYEAQYLWRHLM